MNKYKVIELIDKAINSLEVRKKDEKQAYQEIEWLEAVRKGVLETWTD